MAERQWLITATLRVCETGSGGRLRLDVRRQTPGCRDTRKPYFVLPLRAGRSSALAAAGCRASAGCLRCLV